MDTILNNGKDIYSDDRLSFDSSFKDRVEQVRDSLRYLVSLIVDNESSVKITYNILDNLVYYRLYVSKNDLGKVIGKSGKMADSLKTILNSLSSKRKFRAVLTIEE